MAYQRKIASLSFATETANGVELWDKAGDGLVYSDANEIGRQRADEVVQYMRVNQAPMALGHVVEAIVRGGTYGAVEIGFFGQISLHLMAATLAASEA